MHVLALDTTTREGSVAIVDDDRVIVERRGDATLSQAGRLPVELLMALADCGLEVKDIDLFAVAVGPGSFTGLRIGIAAIQGLALVSQKRIVPVSALAALAEAGCGGLAPGAIVGAWLDAHRHEVFNALYRVGRESKLEEIEGPLVGSPSSVIARWREMGMAPQVVIGDGAVAYADLLPHPIRAMAPPPLAAFVGLIAVGLARAGGSVEPGLVQPLYVRRPDVEMAREARGE